MGVGENSQARLLFLSRLLCASKVDFFGQEAQVFKNFNRLQEETECN